MLLILFCTYLLYCSRIHANTTEKRFKNEEIYQATSDHISISSFRENESHTFHEKYRNGVAMKRHERLDKTSTRIVPQSFWNSGRFLNESPLNSKKAKNFYRKNKAAPKLDTRNDQLLSRKIFFDHDENLSATTISSVECGNEESVVKVKVLTDDWPEQSSWSIVDLTNNGVIRKGGSYDQENKKYSDKFCMQPGSFKLTMSDNWGDGLCPQWSNSLYCGAYEVSINDVVAGRGSSFGYDQEVKFIICTEDSECNDSDKCTNDSCNNKLCVNEPMLCSDCGGNDVVLKIKADDYPYQITWDIKNIDSNSTFYSGGAYNKTEEVFTEEFCLSEGKYEFAMYDSYGDGICPTWSSICGYYEINVNNMTAVSGSAFSIEQVKGFILCTTNKQCEDNNPCTKDLCHNNVCTNEQLPCSECNGINVTVMIRTDDRPHHSTWEIINSISNTKANTGGAYAQSDNLYSESFCLSSGMYIFNMFDYWGDGMCRDDSSSSSCGCYELRIDDGVAVKGGRGFWKTISKEFIICSLDSDCDDNNPCTTNSCNLETKQCEHSIVHSQECGAFGVRTALAIRVNALDSTVSNSTDDISRHMFGAFGNSISMSSQFAACSYNAFNISPFIGKTSTDVDISHGVTEINIDENVQGESAQTVADKVLAIANELLGNLEDQFDFVLVCLPPGTQTGSYQWKAYAFLDSYLSIYNDVNCIYLSVLMHEIGHNVGLGHSNEDKAYGDLTGNMGGTNAEMNGPKKCFNAAMSWQLGWYADAGYVVDIKALKTDVAHWCGLVGASDHNKRENGCQL